jgi:hypothetical protein
MNTNEMTTDEELEIECLANCGARFSAAASPNADTEESLWAEIKAVIEAGYPTHKNETRIAEIEAIIAPFNHPKHNIYARLWRLLTGNYDDWTRIEREKTKERDAASLAAFNKQNREQAARDIAYATYDHD